MKTRNKENVLKIKSSGTDVLLRWSVNAQPLIRVAQLGTPSLWPDLIIFDQRCESQFRYKQKPEKEADPRNKFSLEDTSLVN